MVIKDKVTGDTDDKASPTRASGGSPSGPLAVGTNPRA